MKQTIFTTVLLAFLGISNFTFAQVGIGTTTPNPSAILDLNSTDKALLLPRVANVAAITNPVDGMMVYDTNSKCSKVFENGLWSSCLNKSGNLSYSITPSNPDNEGFHGLIVLSLNSPGYYLNFSVRVTNEGTYPIDVAFSVDDFNLTGSKNNLIEEKILTTPASVQILPGSSTLVTCRFDPSTIYPTGDSLVGTFAKFGKSVSQTIVKANLFSNPPVEFQYVGCSKNIINREYFTDWIVYTAGVSSTYAEVSSDGVITGILDGGNYSAISGIMIGTDLRIFRINNFVGESYPDDPDIEIIGRTIEYTGAQSGTYNWPEGVPSADVTFWGGGASGGSRSSIGTAGGGGGGAYCQTTVNKGVATNYTIGVGVGPGTTPSSGNNNGTAGPNAVFTNSTITYTGSGGGGGQTGGTRGAGGTCSATGGGTFNTTQSGNGGTNTTVGGACGNGSGDNKGANTAATPGIGGNGDSGNNRGGGGGGAVSTFGGNNTGGAGTDAWVRVTYGCPAP